MTNGRPNSKDDVYGPPNNYAIDYAYLYYIKPNELPHKQMEVYAYPLPQPAILDQAGVEAIITLADQGKIKPVVFEIANLPWHYPSYLIFAMKDKNYQFTKGNAVKFAYDPVFGGGGNHNFKHGQDILNGANYLTGMWCVNKRLRENGQALGHRTEKFRVSFPNLKLPHSNPPIFRQFLEILRRLVRLKFHGLLEIANHNESNQNIGP
ncbi:MAG TPA: hypothetical protein VEA60_12445 [Allosphingosinicella sp.]|nr:hypothetical protein [Allosphingosinicella sp.]